MIFSLFWEEAFIRRGGVYSGGGRLFEGGVYFKIRDFRGAFIRGGVYSRWGVYSRKYGIHCFAKYLNFAKFLQVFMKSRNLDISKK